MEDNKTLLDYSINEGIKIILYKKIQSPNIIIEDEKINIQYDKKNIQLNFNENETILKLKEKINEKINVPIEQQILIFNKDELKDNNLLKDYNIHKNSIIYLFTKKKNEYELYVENNNCIYNIKFSSNDTIENIKKEILNILSIPIEKQQLYHEGIELENDKNIFDYYSQVNQKSILYLILQLKLEITIQYNSENYTSIYSKPNDTIETIKKLIEKKKNYPSMYMELIYNNEKLENHKLLSDYQIQNYSIINIKIKNRIYIKLFTGKQITIYIENNTTIKEIKNIISQKEGLDLNKYRLIYRAKHLIDEKTINDYNIEKESYLSLIPRANDAIEIFITIYGKKYTIDVKNNEIIDDIILKFPEIKEGDLYFKGNKLEKNKYVKDYNIIKGDNLSLEKPIFQKIQKKQINNKGNGIKTIKEIEIQNLNGQSFHIEINPNDTLKTIKEKIKERDNIPLDHQILCIGNKIIEDNKTLADYNIIKEIKLNLMLRLRGG